MNAKVINLADFRRENNKKRISKENSLDKYVNKYKEALKRMSKEEIMRMEELLEN